MRVISRTALVIFGEGHPDSIKPMDRRYRAARKATWANFAEVRAAFASADQAGNPIVFNVGGTNST